MIRYRHVVRLVAMWLAVFAASVVYAQAPRRSVVQVVTAKAPRPTLAADRTVQFIYFVPADKPVSPRYAAAIRAGETRFAAWYSDQLEGRRMRLSAISLIACRGGQPHAYYTTQSYTRVLEAVNRCFPQVRLNDPAHLWVIYADVRHACDDADRMGAGTSSTTIMPIQDMQGLAGETQIINDCGDVNHSTGAAGIDRWIGGLAHEFGHAAGLPHPPGCEEKLRSCPTGALMWAGYATFPRTYLRDAEKSHLIASGFFDPQ